MEDVITTETPKQEPNIGWICPRCGRAVSPDVKVCPCNKSDNNSLNSDEAMILS